MSSSPILRVARPTDDLDALVRFYRNGLGFEVLQHFENHDGVDGMMFGHPGQVYHLEFTCTHGHPAGRAPTRDNLIVLYLPEGSAWRSAVERMRAAGIEPVASLNPY